MLFPWFRVLLVEGVFTDCGVVHIVARTLDGTASYPDCELPSSNVRGWYERWLAGTPAGDQPVVIALIVRTAVLR